MKAEKSSKSPVRIFVTSSSFGSTVPLADGSALGFAHGNVLHLKVLILLERFLDLKLRLRAFSSPEPHQG